MKSKKETAAIRTHSICRLVKGEDLNHHGRLFAGRVAEWFVDSGFIAAASLADPENIVCLNVHGMLFLKPIKNGMVIRFDSKPVFAGRTRLVSYVKVVDNNSEELFVDGFITFIHVDRDSKAIPHGITVQAVNPEDIELQRKAKNLVGR
jgi:acyl-CoA hydrolase